MICDDQINNAYFEWMIRKVSDQRFPEDISYRKLFAQLHDTPFRYSVRNDENRYKDGLDLRYRFAYEHPDIPDAEAYLRGKCSVLEMMVALSIRCEESIMDDPRMGDRTGQWFWGMVSNLGLGSMTDDKYAKWFVKDTLKRFLDRDYEPNGRGGLFTVRNAAHDMRDAEIWFQMCWYLDNIV